MTDIDKCNLQVRRKLSLYEEEIYGQDDEIKDLKKYLICQINQELYALDALYVKQIITTPAYAPLPHVPPFILGVFNLRGIIISLTDLAMILNIKGEEIKADSKTVIVEYDGVTTGFLVDRTLSVIDYSSADIGPVVSTLRYGDKESIAGQFDFKGKLIALLHIENVLARTIDTLRSF